MAQILAKLANLSLSRYDLYGPRFVLTLDMSILWFREGGRFEWDRVHYTLAREPFCWSGDFLLRANGQTLASATKPSFWLRKFIVRIDQRELVIKTPFFITRRFVVLENDSVVGQIARKGFIYLRGFSLSVHWTVELPDYLSVPVKVFIFWLIVLMWRRYYITIPVIFSIIIPAAGVIAMLVQR
jgi:hypothetical protein